VTTLVSCFTAIVQKVLDERFVEGREQLGIDVT
jgi:hypothetical protein